MPLVWFSWAERCEPIAASSEEARLAVSVRSRSDRCARTANYPPKAGPGDTEGRSVSRLPAQLLLERRGINN